MQLVSVRTAVLDFDLVTYLLIEGSLISSSGTHDVFLTRKHIYICVGTGKNWHELNAKPVL